MQRNSLYCSCWAACILISLYLCADVMAYMPPELFSVAGAGALDADTFGGQIVNLLGFGFGPLSATRGAFNQDPMLLVTYGVVRLR